MPCWKNFDVLLQSIISGTVVLSHHITRYSQTLVHSQILHQNSRRWPLCKPVNVGIAVGNTAEKIFAGRSHIASLVALTISSADWNGRPRMFPFKQGGKNPMVRNQVSIKDVAKRWAVVLPAPLGQAQSDVQGRCHVATASSSCTKAQDNYAKLNCVDGEESPCSSVCLQSLLLGWIPCEQFQMSWNNGVGSILEVLPKLFCVKTSRCM
jgi:hypothetical protein